eukprot:2539167-Pleurochrysis_carterae.AAC.1
MGLRGALGVGGPCVAAAGPPLGRRPPLRRLRHPVSSPRRRDGARGGGRVLRPGFPCRGAGVGDVATLA